MKTSLFFVGLTCGIVGLTVGLIGIVYGELTMMVTASPAMAQMGDFYMLPKSEPEREPEQPNMAEQGEAVSRQAAESMERCTTHVNALNFLMMAKCLEFMKNWNATITEFNHNNSMTMIEIMLGQVSNESNK